MDRRTRKPLARRTLTEWFSLLESVSPGAPPLKVDREKGIVYRVKVCGRYSANNHGVREATEGTEYTRSAWESEARLINAGGVSAKVRVDHPDHLNPAAGRSAYESLGVLRNAIVESAGDNPGVFADLHMVTANPMAQRVMEDAEKGLGVYGLSHNAVWGKADVKNRRLTIESIESCRGVDLVDKPATNRNLAESDRSRTVKYTLKSILESRKAKFSAPRIKWAKRLLEDDSYGGDMATETDDVPAETDPDEAMWSGFEAAIGAVLAAYKAGDVDDKAATKKIGDYLKTHGKLTQTEEPDEPEELEESEDDDDGPGGDDPSEKKKASESLRLENAKLKREVANQKLCLEAGVTLSPLDTRLLNLLEADADRRAFVAERKPGNPGGRPRSAAGGKSALESQGKGQQAPAGAAGALSILRRG